MDELTQFLTTAGQIDIAKLILLIGFIFAITVLYLVRNFGTGQKRDDEFRQEQLVIQRQQTEAIMLTQSEDRSAFLKALETFNEETRLNREERQRDFEYRSTLRENVENALKENKAAVNSFEAALGNMTEAQATSLQSLVEVKNKLDAVVEAIDGYHKLVSQSADTQQRKNIETLERIERAIARIDKYMNELIESKVKESKPNGSTKRPTEE